MTKDIAKGMRELAFKMRLIKANQEEQMNGPLKGRLTTEGLSERESLILELLYEKGKMTVSQIAAADPGACDSTISSTITKLWRDKNMVTKTISPQNQRNTYIELTDKGRETTELFIKMRDERFRTLFEAINVTEEEKEVLYNVLNRATRFFKQRFDTANVRNNNILINNSGSALVQSKGET